MALRWKKNPAETGLRAVGAGPRGSKLHDGTDEYASVYPLGGNWRGPLRGWYWVAVSREHGVPYCNTCNEPPQSEAAAKTAAMAYVKQHLKVPKEPTP
jgi:hypothetical protein